MFPAETDSRPLIVGFVGDLYFTSRIESAAEKLGYQLRWIERADQVAAPDPSAPARQLAEHLVGPGAVLIEQLTLWKPRLLIFDLNNAQVPWREWISMLTSAPATRRIPVIAFGSHMQADQLQAARSAGATAVTARSRFFTDLPALLEKFARKVDPAEMETACRQPLHPEALRGLEAFNHGEYFEAHEYLEAAWKADSSSGRDLYQAVLQVAVAYYQIQRGNFRGAQKMFLRMRQWIDPLPDTCRGVEIARLRAEARLVQQAMLDAGPERMDEIDMGLLKPVIYKA
jgi:predicted metal-dependent hydrolase